MGAKVVIAKDWWKRDASRPVKQTRMIHKFEQGEVYRSEDLPELMTIKEVAAICKVHEKTVHKWVQQKELQSIKLKGARRITPEQLAEFLAEQFRKNG